MRVATGTVVDGRFVIDGVPFAAGARATVLARGADGGCTLSNAADTALPESLAEVARGALVAPDAVPAALPRA